MADFLDTFVSHLALLACINPLIGAGLVLMAGRNSTNTARRIAVVNALVTCLLAALLIVHYDPQARSASGAAQTVQMVCRFAWLAEAEVPQIEFAVGIDGVSLWFVALAAVLMLPALVCDPGNEVPRPASYYALLLAVHASANMLFTALDAVLFLACLEGVVVPLFFLAGRYGGSGRRPAIRKLLLFNLAGSLLVFAGILGAVAAHQRMNSIVSGARQSARFSIEALTVGDRDVLSIQQLAQTDEAAFLYWRRMQGWLFWTLLVGLALKSALVPLHTWLATSAAEMPPSVRILLLGVMTKMGCYGCVRILLPWFPDTCLAHAALLPSIAAWGVVYASLWTLAQEDCRRVIAGWSVAQTGLAAAAIFSLNAAGMAGAMLLMVHHGLAAACLVWFVSSIEFRSRNARSGCSDDRLSADGKLTTMLFVALAAAVAVPGTAGFAGSILTILGVFSGNAVIRGSLGAAFWLMAGMVILAWALVQMTRRVLRSAADSDDTQPAPHSAPRASLAIAVLLLALIIAIGLAPFFVVERLEPSLRRILSAYPPALGGPVNRGEAALRPAEQIGERSPSMSR